MAKLFDFVRNKFRQSKDYTQEMLIRDLLESFREIGAVIEVGPWTPELRFGGATTGIVYGTQAGTYIKIGKLFFAGFEVVLTNKGTAVGTAQIAGVPVASGGQANNGSGSTGLVTGMAGLQGPIQISMAGSLIDLRHNLATGVGYGTLADTNFTNTARIRGHVWHIIP